MKKIFIALIVFFTVATFCSQALAQDLGAGSGGLAGRIWSNAGGDASATQYTLPETIGRVIQVVLSMVGTIFFALTVYAGFIWMTAQGNDEKVTKAKGILTTAVIGVVIVVAAYSITAFALIWSHKATEFTHVE